MALVLLVLPSMSTAQIIEPLLSFSGAPASNPKDCDDWSYCAGEASFDELGEYEFAVVPQMWGADRARFSLDFPAEWEVLDYEVCGGQLVAGDPTVSGSSIEVAADDCWWGQASLVLRVDCSKQGTIVLTYPQGEDEYQARDCISGQWQSGDEGHFAPQAVNIGEFCGRDLRADVCDLCNEYLACEFDSSHLVVRVTEGEVIGISVNVTGDDNPNTCGQTAECGGHDYEDAACFGDLEEDIEWLQIDKISDSWTRHRYSFLIDGTTLSPGTYSGLVSCSTGGCPYCHASCVEIDLTVEPQPAAADDVTGEDEHAFTVLSSNPVDAALRFQLNLASETHVRVEIFDSAGRTIAIVQDGLLAQGQHELDWPTHRLGSGVYHLRVHTPRLVEQASFVVLH